MLFRTKYNKLKAHENFNLIELIDYNNGQLWNTRNLMKLTVICIIT